LYIFSSLHFNSLFNCARVCKYWNHVVNSDELWRRIAFKYWNMPSNKSNWKKYVSQKFNNLKNIRRGKYTVKLLSKCNSPQSLLQLYGDHLGYSKSPNSICLRNLHTNSTTQFKGNGPFKFNDSSLFCVNNEIHKVNESTISCYSLQSKEETAKLTVNFQNYRIRTIDINDKYLLISANPRSMVNVCSLFELHTGKEWKSSSDILQASFFGSNLLILKAKNMQLQSVDGQTLGSFNLPSQGVTKFVMDGNQLVTWQYNDQIFLYDIRKPSDYQEIRLLDPPPQNSSFHRTRSEDYARQSSHVPAVLSHNKFTFARYYQPVIWSLSTMKWDAVIIPKKAAILQSFFWYNNSMVVASRPLIANTHLIELWDFN